VIFISNIGSRSVHIKSVKSVSLSVCLSHVSINQSKQILIAPCVASESEARDGRD